MKLFQLVMWRMSTILVVILTCWAVLFYLAIMEEVNDEVDDSLSDYAESLMLRSCSGVSVICLVVLYSVEVTNTSP